MIIRYEVRAALPVYDTCPVDGRWYREVRSYLLPEENVWRRRFPDGKVYTQIDSDSPNQHMSGD